MRILVLGAGGMAGHIIADVLGKYHDVTGLVRGTGHPTVSCVKMDVLDSAKLTSFLYKNSYDVVVNSVGILNQDASDHIEQAIMLNSHLPHMLSRVCSDYGGRVIHLSTDCVFSGNSGRYVEDSFRDGDTVYDRTKALGEIINNRDLTFRTSIIGPDIKEEGIGLFNWYMKQEGQIRGYRSVLWTGITTIFLARGILEAINQNLTGLYHLVSKSYISKHDLLLLFQKCFEHDLVITPVDEPVSDKSMLNTRNDFDFAVPSYDEMIHDMKQWISDHKQWYPHYIL